MQNIIIKGNDNPVIIEFTFTGDFEANGLDNFTRITLTIGAETYATDDAQPKLVVVSKTELRLNVGDTTTLDAGYYTPEIVGYSITYDDGYVLTSDARKELQDLEVR